MNPLRALTLLCVLFLMGCSFTPSFHLEQNTGKNYLTDRVEGTHRYEGYLFRTPEYIGFIFEGWPKGLQLKAFPTMLAYFVIEVEDDHGLFESWKNCDCSAARIRFVGEFMDEDKSSPDQMFLGSLKIDSIHSYEILTQEQVKSILRGGG